MRFYRKAELALSKWSAKQDRKPLLLRGARQVGKSTLVREFGKQFEIFIELNLERQSDAALFEQVNDVYELMEAICLTKNVAWKPEQTLLFIDEIQELPTVISLLRFFYEDLPQLHVVAAGSLLEFAMGEVQSMPVGRIDILRLHPMDFEEFLMACNENTLLQYYQKIPLSPVAYSKTMELFNRYLMVGGMPAVVQQYILGEKTIVGLQDSYASIWQVYKQDIEKYGKNDTARKVLRHVVQTAPYERDRITLGGFGSSQYRSREVAEAFTALELAGLIRLIYPTTDTAPPCLPDLKRKPRLQFLDTGLLNYAGNLHSEMVLLQDFTDFYRGYIVSHVVMQERIATEPRPDYKPVFWVREKSTSNAEVDLIVQWNGLAIPVEIKSGAEGRLRSLHAYMDSCPHNLAVRLLGNKVQVENATTLQGKPYTLINLPYCCGALIPAYLDWVAESGNLPKELP
ncbi:MAG: AAA family ATPase [Chitinophagaceae bacterium]|nr:AAA family ATPase [Chitinophagaceae bacterium]